MSHDFLVQLPAAPTVALLAQVRAELAKLPIRVELPGDFDLVNDSGWVPVAVHAIDRPALAGLADCPHWSGFEYGCGEDDEGHHELVLAAKITSRHHSLTKPVPFQRTMDCREPSAQSSPTPHIRSPS